MLISVLFMALAAQATVETDRQDLRHFLVEDARKQLAAGMAKHGEEIDVSTFRPYGCSASHDDVRFVCSFKASADLRGKQANYEVKAQTCVYARGKPKACQENLKVTMTATNRQNHDRFGKHSTCLVANSTDTERWPIDDKVVRFFIVSNSATGQHVTTFPFTLPVYPTVHYQYPGTCKVSLPYARLLNSVVL